MGLRRLQIQTCGHLTRWNHQASQLSTSQQTSIRGGSREEPENDLCILCQIIPKPTQEEVLQSRTKGKSTKILALPASSLTEMEGLFVDRVFVRSCMAQRARQDHDSAAESASDLCVL